MSGPLNGIRVLDLTRLLPGPFCTLMLSDLGAQVVKVEDMAGGDYARVSPPVAPDGQGGMFHFLNRGKRSIKLNLKKPEGVELLKRLVREADILVESFRPGVMDKLGVGYETLKKENKKLIYCCISGYGWSGPLKDAAGHDNNYLSYAGVLGVSGERDRRPSLSGVQVADVAAGALFGAVGILAALHQAQTSGEGAFIDTSMTDGAFAILGPHLANFACERMAKADTPAPRTGEMLLAGKICAYTVYETSDGRHMSMGALEPKFWSAFIKAVERPDLMGAAFTDAKDGQKYYEQMKELFASKTFEQWRALLKDVDCCVEPVLLLDEVLEEPHFVERGLWAEIPVKDGKSVRVPRMPFFFDGKVLHGADTPGPRQGADTADFLKESGLTEDEIEALKKAGAVS